MTEDRLVQTQKNIAENAAKPARICGDHWSSTKCGVRVSSVRAEVAGRSEPPGRLRKAPPAVAPGEDSDEKPTLKRRDLVD